MLAVFGDEKSTRYAQVQELITCFFKGNEDVHPDEAVGIFIGFMNPPSEKNLRLTATGAPSGNREEREKRYDYYFDSEEIYASFLSEYNINLIRVDFLHWREFDMLLRNLSKESAFRKKLEMRFLDLSVYAGNSRAYAEMSRAKRAVQLPVNLSEEELREMEAFDDEWGRI